MKISLVLGSGGARGYAHIGVIEELERAGFEIASISGASMGALVGGLYAAGGLEAYKEWVLGLDVWDVAALLDISFDKRGLIKGERVFAKLHEIVGDVRIEELPIKYTAVATDIEQNKEVWFQKGDLLQAIRASISIPSFFTPVQIERRLLVDGGVLNPLPVAPTMSDHTQMTIAVSLYGEPQSHSIDIPKERRERQERLAEALQKLAEYAKSLTKDEEYSFFDIVSLSFDAMQKTLIRYRLAGYPPDHLIEIPQNICGTYDFHKAYEVIEAGREAAKRFLAEAERSLPPSVLDQ